MKELLGTREIQEALEELCERIASDLPDGEKIALIGIRSRGETLAQRLSGLLSKRLGRDLECGTLDITLYRDDLNEVNGSRQPQVGVTEIAFDIADKIIILVDDVLYTGRSVRAAITALMDLGRPKAVKLAVLVERGPRELPIHADYIARHVEIEAGKSVQVLLEETDGEDKVVVE